MLYLGLLFDQVLDINQVVVLGSLELLNNTQSYQLCCVYSEIIGVYPITFLKAVAPSFVICVEVVWVLSADSYSKQQSQRRTGVFVLRILLRIHFLRILPCNSEGFFLGVSGSMRS